jgi:hypothetical protein
MKRRARPLVYLGGVSVAIGVALGACGVRTGLDAPLKVVGAGAFVLDAGADGDPEASFDATVDAGFDATFDAGFDALFPVDSIAPIDVHVASDSGLVCPDGRVPNAYLLRRDGALFTFDPATLATQILGIPNCGAGVLNSSWTLSVSRDGSAYIVAQTPWAIYKVDLASPSLTCTRTPFVNGQLDLQADYSIAVSRTAGVEKLFFYGEPGLPDGGLYPNTPPILAVSDLTSFVLTEVAPVLPMPPSNSYPLDMQGDPLGHLFGYSDDGLLIELDSTRGAAIGQAQTNLPGGSDWAVMSYENDIYLFADNGSGGSSVARYDLATQTLTIRGGVSVQVVGASAVPCFRAGLVPPPP